MDERHPLHQGSSYRVGKFWRRGSGATLGALVVFGMFGFGGGGQGKEEKVTRLFSN